MGPSLRVRPHRPTYMRLQKDHQKPAKKKRRRRREMPRHPPPTLWVGGCQHSAPPTGTPHPYPGLRHQHPLSSLPRLPVCHHHPQRVSPPAFSKNPILWLEKLSPPWTYKVMSETVRDCGSAPPMSSPIACPSLNAPAPQTHMYCCVCSGVWTNEYILCMLKKLPVYNDTTTKKARVQRTFYPISL